jgi:hypothetical protein
VQQLIPWLIFCAAFLLFSLVRPNGARIFIGIFFIVMALGVNALLSFLAPELFVSIGTDGPLIPFYAWLFENVVAVAPAVVGIVAVAEPPDGRWTGPAADQRISTCPLGHGTRELTVSRDNPDDGDVDQQIEGKPAVKHQYGERQ